MLFITQTTLSRHEVLVKHEVELNIDVNEAQEDHLSNYDFTEIKL